MTEDEADFCFRLHLHECGKSECHNCGKPIDRGDLAWNDAATEAGTPCSWAQIQCQRCDTEIAFWHSWWPDGAADFIEFVEHILPDLK